MQYLFSIFTLNSDFQWSPTSNLLAYSVAQRDQVPARVTIIQIPNRKEIRVKNIGVNAENVRLSWHPDGKYFSITRRNKTKKVNSFLKDILLSKKVKGKWALLLAPTRFFGNTFYLVLVILKALECWEYCV